jgi:hypothetical protein
MRAYIRVIFSAILFVLLVTGCRKNQNQVPYVLVDVYININNPGYYTLQAVGGWVYYPAGSKGLIIYRKTVDEMVVFDRHSPYLPDNNCITEVDETTNITVFDPCSGSEFLLVDGSVTKGPAVFPLQQYQSSFDGTMLHIYN